jgi:hypothetical protein
MRTFSFPLAGARLAYLLVITRVDETVIRLTSYSRRLTISSNTFYPDPGLEIGDYTETNNGEVPNLTFKVATRDGGLFVREDIENGLFDRAQAVLYITDARNPSLDDVEVIGSLKGEVKFDLEGNAEFELLNKFNLIRDVGGHKYTIEDWAQFGDPRWNKIPNFPTVDETSDDLIDVERNTALVLGERRRFRYDNDDDPSDYHNVYWEVTTAGTTGASEPVGPSDTPSATVTDGSAVFTVRNAYARAFQVASIIDENHITITVTEPRATDDTWFAPGVIWMRTGYMKGFLSDVDAYDQGTNQISIVMPFGNLLEVGDWGEISPGYDQTLDMAAEKYGAALTSVTEPISADGGPNNYRGFPHITGARFFTSQFIPGVSEDSPADADDPGAGGGEGGEGGGYEAFAVEFLAGTD